MLSYLLAVSVLLCVSNVVILTGSVSVICVSNVVILTGGVSVILCV